MKKEDLAPIKGWRLTGMRGCKEARGRTGRFKRPK